MKYPTRCNKRSCQARRPLNKHPDDYKRPPRCHFRNCDGLMYLDKHRFEKKEAKHRPVCHQDCYPYPHRVDSPHCRQRTDWVIKKSLEPLPKHHPHPVPDDNHPPF